jgi:hypothetical protein
MSLLLTPTNDTKCAVPDKSKAPKRQLKKSRDWSKCSSLCPSGAVDALRRFYGALLNGGCVTPQNQIRLLQHVVRLIRITQQRQHIGKQPPLMFRHQLHKGIRISRRFVGHRGFSSK